MALYPDVAVQLTGTDGNAFAIIGRVSQALAGAGHPTDQFTAEATAGDYEHLLRTVLRYVDAT